MPCLRGAAFAQPVCLNRTTRHWHSHRPVLKHRAQPTKGTEVPWEPGLPGLVP
jgi:hypothetical protein